MSASPPHWHGVDVGLLNTLLSKIRQRLSGGVAGDFFEKGSILKEGSREVQLPLLFSGVKIMEKLVGAIEKEAPTVEANELKDAQKSGAKPNKSMMATIKEMVHAEVETSTRTISIENERMKVAMIKMEKEVIRLSNENESMKNKQKKGGGESAPGGDEKYRALSKKFDGLQKTLKQHEAGQLSLTSKIDALEKALTAADADAVSAIDHNTARVDHEMSNSGRKISALETGLQELTSVVATFCEHLNECTTIDEERHTNVVDMIICFQKKFGMSTWSQYVMVS